MNPLEHHSFRELFSMREQVAISSEARFTLRSYHYSYWFYLKGELREKWWHHIAVEECSEWLRSQALSKGLLSINGIHVCIRCLTNEFVSSKEKLNGGDPTCQCGSRFKGWGEE